ncbi:MAG: hypothetical protein ACRDCE_11465 [Cetobacterium sp.]|uniref:hypothetical protein n=1 Tax=Cetobacterium sp. TaxID=2071632 RepID=UPI003EE4F517
MMKTYFVFFVTYVALSIISMFLTSTPVELFTVFDVAIWLPLSAVTLVPLVDVMRSFTQDAAEKAGMTFKETATQMLVTSMSVAFLCVLFAGLPLPIFVGVLAAVTIGGAADILVFRHMGKYFTNPAARMLFSNFAATIIGSGIVFFVAFTDWFFEPSFLTKPVNEVVVGWLAQSLFIWISSVAIGFTLNAMKKSK